MQLLKIIAMNFQVLFFIEGYNFVALNHVNDFLWSKESEQRVDIQELFHSFQKGGKGQITWSLWGERLFSVYCLSCHKEGKNLILPEKNLQKSTLENLGINKLSALRYQIVNGKNAMPAFGGKLTQKEITSISIFILKEL